MRYIAASALLLFATATSLVAQEHKRVEVTKNYSHEVAPATKLIAPTVISNVQTIEPEIVYNVNPETWQIELDSYNFKPARASYWDFNRADKFFLNVGAGYPLVTDATLRYAVHNLRVGYFGVGVDHHANLANKHDALGLVRDIKESYQMSNGVDVGGGVIVGRQMFEAHLDYDYSLLNRYAELVEHSPLLHFHDANLHLRYGDNFSDLSRLNFGVELYGGYWAHALPSVVNYGELSLGANANLARDFKGNVVGLSLGYDMWNGNNVDKYKDMSFDVAARYARNFGFVNVEAEMGYMYDKVSQRAKASHFFMPCAKVSFDLGKVGLMPYIELDTRVLHNGVESLYCANPYINFDAMQSVFATLPSTLSYDIYAGLSGADKNAKVAYRVYLGANFMRDQVLWYVDTKGTFGATTANNNRLFAGLEAKYNPVGGLTLSASARFHADNCNSDYEVSEARIVADVMAEYQLKRWRFHLAGDFVGRRGWSVVDKDSGAVALAMRAPAYFDLGVGVGFKASRSVEVYANGLNLLNSDIYDYAYYYRNGIGFMAGVKIDF